MKWFKHMTASADDEKLAALVGQGGVDGLALYGAYWRFAEIVAKQMEGKTPSCAVTYPVWRWTQLLFTRKSHLSSVLSQLKKAGLLRVEGDPKTDSYLTVTMPNLLKYRDEYARKSGHTPENVPLNTDTDTDGEKELEKATPVAVTAEAVPAADKGKLLGKLPLNDGTEWEVYEADVLELVPLYPAVNVHQELRSMKGWLIGNPKLRKTRRGILKFITTWLEKEQDKARSGGMFNGKPAITDSISAKQAVLDARRTRRMADEPDHHGGGTETGLPRLGSGGERSAAGSLLEGTVGAWQC